MDDESDPPDLAQAPQAAPSSAVPPLPLPPAPAALGGESPPPAPPGSALLGGEPPSPASPPAARAAPPVADTDKARTYFTAPMAGRHELPLLDEMVPNTRHRLAWLTALVGMFGIGVSVGLYVAPETPKEVEAQRQALTSQLAQRDARIEALKHQMISPSSLREGRLKKADRVRHTREGRHYAASLRRTGAQAAGDLMEWFVGRWNELLDAPNDDDRVTRRAATLALLIGGMAANINPGDYVPWQAEFLGGDWLGDLHFDLDGDGYPAKRNAKNPHDGFANVSVCHVAMALNQAMRDGQVLVMPEMHCDRPEARMSVFLQGPTFNDALDAFVKAVRELGFIAAERQKDGVRLVLIGPKPPPPEE